MSAKTDSTGTPAFQPRAEASDVLAIDRSSDKHVVIVGGGFAGLEVAKRLAGCPGLRVTLIDRRNHHLFQPLLYQVAMAGLSPAEIAVPIRSLLRDANNVRVIAAEVTGVALDARTVHGDFGTLLYDYLVLATGAQHAYFGHDEWEAHAPGLKTVEQATEIRRRVLTAFELAERETDATRRRQYLTFVVVGGGPTGVELAGALGEMSRYTLTRDFREIDPKLTRIMLIEAGSRILPSFSESLSSRATRDLERLGVQVWTGSRVTDVNATGVRVGDERIAAATVLWAAGVQASALGRSLGLPCDRQGRVHVEADTSLADHPEVFIAGDLAHFATENGPLPGVATVALQQGRFIANTIRDELEGRQRGSFRYFDKGQMATIGRRRAICESYGVKLTGFAAWVAWLLVHIYYLTGFRNRLFVLLSWAWSYLTFARGARLIVGKRWQSYGETAPAQSPRRSPSGAPPIQPGVG
ncbi:MAG: NAD(P)/FAD-dependent oxidoreductase [Myxococcales bacterium FL481]|nr:MAG: NAD(P)/FAD-dependent oxidoreductase [Myxococcales bacterium FL481]